MDILGKILPAVIIGIVILVVLGSCVKIVPQSRAYVITRLGVFHSVWN